MQVLDINALMLLAVAGAIAIGEHTEGAAVVVLFAVAAWLEEGCGRRARDALSTAVAMQPTTATLAESGRDMSHKILANPSFSGPFRCGLRGAWRQGCCPTLHGRLGQHWAHSFLLQSRHGTLQGSKCPRTSS